MDGALVILDGSKGIEAQTEIVWRQSNKYNISKICVINKMDLNGADFFKVIENIEKRFKITVFPIMMPIFKKSEFIGVINLLKNTFEYWDATKAERNYKSKKFEFQKLSQ